MRFSAVSARAALLIGAMGALSVATVSRAPKVPSLKPFASSTVLLPLRPATPPRGIRETMRRLWTSPENVIGVASGRRVACYKTEAFVVGGQRFRVLVYPDGVAGQDGGAAAAYLRFLPAFIGDECDVTFSLSLTDSSGEALGVLTSGGKPHDGVSWQCSMTMCDEKEASESLGRARDWGAHVWRTGDVEGMLASGELRARVEVDVWSFREDWTSWPFARGAVGAVVQSLQRDAFSRARAIKAGEVVVPVDGGDGDALRAMRDAGLEPGVEVRVMGMRAPDGSELFSTDAVAPEQRGDVTLALRPVGARGVSNDFPLLVRSDACPGLLSRYAGRAFLPRLAAAMATDLSALLVAIAFATSPLPLALAGRELVSLYSIPTTSMAPTLEKGDVLVVSKVAKQPIRRGDIVLFSPPPSLIELLPASTKSGLNLRGDLFVKRVAGVPGDASVDVDERGSVLIGGSRPDARARDTCGEEPLRLIDRFLEKGVKHLDGIREGELFVLGDCAPVSVDSRVWGTLPEENVAGKPLARVWPLSRLHVGPL